MNPIRVGLLNIEPLLQSDTPVLLIFGAVWDHNSRLYNSRIKYLSEKYDRMVIFGIVDYDYAPDIFSEYGICDIPSMIFFEAGKPIMRHTVYNGTNDIEDFIRKFYGVLPEIKPKRLC